MSDQRAWSAKRPVFLGVLALVTLVGGFGYWAVQARIAGAIIAQGQLEVDRNRQVVQHLDGGVVSEILVEEGDTVDLGQPLIRLDSTLLQSQKLIVEGQLFELMARRGRLEAERDGNNHVAFDPELLAIAAERGTVGELMAGQERLFQARADSTAREIEQLGKRRGQVTDQIVGIKAQQASLAVQLELIHEELENQQSLLGRGLTQASTVLGLRRAAANLDGSLGELVASEAQAEGRITEIGIEILKLGTRQREDAITRLRDLQYRELELAEQRRSLQDRLDRLDISAPVSGIVYGLQVHTPRSVIRPADPVLFLVPQDRPLVIASRVDPIHIDQIFVGQTVSLRFPALNQRETPELSGTVTQVSADAFEDQASQVSFYRVEIVLSEGEFERLPEGTTLIPGMPVESFIRTDDRSPRHVSCQTVDGLFHQGLPRELIFCFSRRRVPVSLRAETRDGGFPVVVSGPDTGVKKIYASREIGCNVQEVSKPGTISDLKAVQLWPACSVIVSFILSSCSLRGCKTSPSRHILLPCGESGHHPVLKAEPRQADKAPSSGQSRFKNL